MAERAALLHPLPPQPTPFIGREKEVAEISEVLAGRPAGSSRSLGLAASAKPAWPCTSPST